MTGRAIWQLLGPVSLVALAAAIGVEVSSSIEIYVIDALVAVAMVAAIHVFVGNSGVLSFGHISFVAVGAWTAGVLTVPVEERSAIMPNLFAWLLHASVGNVGSLLAAAAVAGAFALIVGVPLMRLSGLAASIATFGVLEITHNLLYFYERIGPGSSAFSSVPETTGLLQATLGALGVVGVAFMYQRSRFGQMLRATREDPAVAQAVGISIYWQRLLAFVVSGALAGFAGGLFIHLLPLTIQDMYLPLTLLTLAMLVIGGVSSLWGAVTGAFAVSGLDSLLAVAEGGIDIGGWRVGLPSGSRIVVVSAAMALVLILRPAGLCGGREFSLDRLHRIASRMRQRRD
jgi:branched-chain amino acid transport system permease protein